MGKFISNLFLGALAIGLSIFTGSRTLDLLAWALPANQAVYQWLGLAAFEGGMYFWAFYFVAGAKGTPQRGISVVMAGFSIVAVAIATIVDLSITAAKTGKIAPISADAAQASIIFLGIVIALNVAAFLSCKLLSIDNLRTMKEQSAEDTIHDAGLRAITAIAPSIAASAAPHLAEEWANRTWERLVPGVGHTEFIDYRETQRQRRLAPSSVVPDEETALARDARRPVVESKPPKKGFFSSLFKRGEQQQPASQAQEVLTPSEKTSNQIYREERRQRNYRAAYQPDYNAREVVAARRKQRQMKLARPVQSIDRKTEEVPVTVPFDVPTAGQGVDSQTKSTRRPGSRGKKPASVDTATRAK